MKYYPIAANKSFVGRKEEISRLNRIMETRKEAKFIVMYGRRRIGKTELIEQFFRQKHVLKFEGIQLPRNDKRNEQQQREYQLEHAYRQLAKYLENEAIGKIRASRWTDFFEEIDTLAQNEEIIIYFEEIQWLTNYKTDFFAELKPFWDSYWRRNSALTIVICGSSTSFITEQLLQNQALYARDQHEFHLQAMNLIESGELLRKTGKKEILTAYISLGGIPAYLKRLGGRGTIYSNICQHSFSRDAYFLLEYEKIFVSSMAHYRYYRDILEFLTSKRYASAKEIAKKVLGKEQTGGKFEAILDDLSSCGFIERYVPIDRNENSRLVRYRIKDEYLSFYYKLIKPKKNKIKNGYFPDPTAAINHANFNKLLGFAFERWCLKNHHVIARFLQINKLNFSAGSYFSRAISKQIPGFQIDLMFIVEGVKIIICELKYYTGTITSKITKDIDQKIELFLAHNKQYEKATIEKVLITTEGPDKKLLYQEYFDEIITLDDIFNPTYWE